MVLLQFNVFDFARNYITFTTIGFCNRKYKDVVVKSSSCHITIDSSS